MLGIRTSESGLAVRHFHFVRRYFHQLTERETSARPPAGRRLHLERLEPILPLAWSALGDNILLSNLQNPDRDQVDPVVALSPGQFTATGSNFVLVYQIETKADFSGTLIYYRRVNGDGTTTGQAAPRPIFSQVAGNFDAQDPRISMANDGSFVVTWEETTSAGTQQVYYTRFNTNGNPDPDHTAVPVSFPGNNSNPDVYYAPDGKYFVVTWQNQLSSTNRDIYFQMVDLATLGLPIGPIAAGASPRNEFQPHIAGKTTGATSAASDSVVIVWTEGTRTETSRLDVGFNVFQIATGTPNSDGQLVTDNDNSVNTTTFNLDQYQASVAADGDGNFVIVYSELTTVVAPLDHNLYFRRYTTGGTAVDTIRRPIETGSDNTNQASVARAQDGSFVVVYEVADATQNRVDIKFNGFNPNGNRINIGTPVSSRNTRSGSGVFLDNPSLGMNALGNFVVVWGDNVNVRDTSTRTPGFMDIVGQRYEISASASIVASGVTNVTAPTTSSVLIDVNLQSALPIDPATVQSSVLEVVAPDNTILQAPFAGLQANSTNTAMRATYRLAAPGGTWDQSDNGNYTVRLVGETVKDTSGNMLVGQNLTTFAVEVPAPDTSPPTISGFTAPQFNSDGTATFTITYQDNVAVSAVDLDNDDVLVTGPGGFSILATLKSANDLLTGTTATYSIVAPGGTWNAADNGTYTVSLVAGQIRDINGNAATSQVAGSFTVALPPDPTSPWHNTVLPYDVNNDGRVSGLDVLLIVNRLNQGIRGLLPTPTSTVTTFVDVNGDGAISAVDAIQVINYLNRAAAASRQAASAALPSAAVATTASTRAAELSAAQQDALLAARSVAIEQEADRLRTGKSKIR